MIRVEGLTKRFGHLTAVDSLSFEVADGDLFALLGTNGAGKTTTIACMVTLLSYDEGRITIDELAPGRDDQRIGNGSVSCSSSPCWIPCSPSTKTCASGRRSATLPPPGSTNSPS